MQEHFDRRRFLLLAGSGAALSLAGCGRGPGKAAAAAGAPELKGDALLVDLQQRTFRFFWQTTDTKLGLAPDRYPTPSFASIAAIGFALTAFVIGVERHWITRDEARERVLSTLNFLRDAPQGPEPAGRSGYRGFFYHFLHMTTGERYATCELSTIDTALLMAGVRCCGQYFNANDEAEARIRRFADELIGRVEWTWAQPRAPLINLAWTPEKGFSGYDWRGYNEAMLIYLMALGSPTHPVGTDAWEAWTSGYAKSWASLEGFEHLTFGPLFGHQYTHVWVDFRGMPDGYLRQRNSDYFINSQRAVQSQRAYAIRNPLGWQGYGANCWGLTACDGPYDGALPYNGGQRMFRTYAARGVGLLENYDDGTIAPTAAAASIAFAPELVLPMLEHLYAHYGSALLGSYGFLDAFNPSFHFDDVLPAKGRRAGELGWVDNDYLGIDQGPIVAMIENYRSGLIWRTMQNDPILRKGLQRAGFSGGWLA